VISASDAIARCLIDRPDALVLDLRLKDSTGGQVIEELEERSVLPRLVVIIGHLSAYVVYRLERLTVPCSIVDKESGCIDSIAAAVTAVASGHRWVSAGYLSFQFHARFDLKVMSLMLSPKQHLFLRFVALGLSDREIAERMRISTRTAEGYRSVLIQKLGVENSVGLVCYARLKGFDLFPPRLMRRAPGEIEAASAELQCSNSREGCG
jgi:DNA-binding NarL/FixJ family response regulator